MVMTPDEVRVTNERNDRLNRKLDTLEEQVIDSLVYMLDGTIDKDRETIQVVATAAGVLKANKRSVPPNLTVAASDPTGGLVDDAEELPTGFNGERR